MGCLIILSVMITAIFAPFISPFDPFNADLNRRLKPPGWQNGNDTYWLGTDHLGRDILSRIIYGSRISLFIGISALLIGSILGTTIGLISAYFGGKVDTIFMRLGDVQLAFPFILLLVAVIAVLGPSIRNMILVLGITSWVVYARVIRSEVLSMRESEFITAAKALGCSNFRIIFTHLLPNVAPSANVIGTLEMARIILLESSLSFLGLGVQPPTPSWGMMLSEGRIYLYTAWWFTTFPGLALMITVLGINIVGDWLRDFIR